MKEFRIGPKGLKELRKRNLILLLACAGVAIGVLVIMILRNADDETDLIPYMIGLGVGVVFISISAWNSTRKQKKALQDYCVTIGDDHISQQITKGHVHSIGFMEIREILKTSKGHFLVKGEGQGNQIAIPKYIDDYDDLEARLQKLAPIEAKTPPMYKYAIPLTILLLALTITVFSTENPIVIGIAGPVLVILLGWLFYLGQINKAWPKRAKRRSWTMLIGIAAILWKMYTVFK